MGTFSASLRTIGDVKSLTATVELSDGQLRIFAGDAEIGSWPLSDIHLEEIPTGYRLAAEGEQIVIELRDVDTFGAELAANSKKRLGFRRGKSSTHADSETTAPAAAEPPQPPKVSLEVEAPPVKAQPVRQMAQPPGSVQDEKPSGWTTRGLSLVDGTLAKASKRFGPYLPEWMFTRAMFAIAFGALVLMLVFPGMVSTFLVISGVLMVLFGAIVLSDTMLASRWLPGRSTPQHVLLFGLAILMMGVLLGVVTR